MSVRIPKKHPEKALTPMRVRNEKKPGRYADGNGLYLVVDPSGAKRWVLRTVVQGKRRDIGLGGVRTTTLAEAREEATAMRKIARNGGNPILERKKQRRLVPTFEEAARTVHRHRKPSWKNPKHAAQWINTLTTYAFPAIGDSPVDMIDTPDVLQVLEPIWLAKPETARRVKQRIGIVLDWAKAHSHREGDNPIDGVDSALAKQPKKDRHYKALPYNEIAEFIAQLREYLGVDIPRLGLEFLILTASRTNEVLGAKWNEIHIQNKIWTIPEERMKARNTHRVPLTRRCLEILQIMKPLKAEGNYIFPGRFHSKPLSNMAFAMIVRRMNVDATVHGFRSTFRDWAAEQTNFPREVCEMALAHTISNSVEAAYRRGDLFEKRRKLMDSWEQYILSTQTSGEVAPITGKR